MNFLGLGPGELVLICMLGLIVFGPGKLPEIAAQIGRTVRDFRQSTTEITSEFQRTFSIEELTRVEDRSATSVATGPAELDDAQHAIEAARSPSDANLSGAARTAVSEWNWETADSQTAASLPSSGAGSNGSFWEWDEQPASSENGTTLQTETASASPRAGAWEWDTSDPAQPPPVSQEKPPANG
jgi:TatA/E family protein of Tat protein translocase